MIARPFVRALMGLMLLLGAAEILAADYYVDITNATGYRVVRLEVSPASSTSWEENLLGKGTFGSGETKRVTLSGYDSPIFDIRLTDEDGDTYTFFGVDVQRQDLRVTLADIDGGDAGGGQGYYVDVTNATGYTMLFLQVSPVTSDSWGQDLLGEDVLGPGETTRVTLTGYASPMFDIRLTDVDGDTYSFYGIDVEREDLIVTLDALDAN